MISLIIFCLGWFFGYKISNLRLKFIVKNELKKVGSFFMKIGRLELTYKTPKFEPTHSEREGWQKPSISIAGYRLFVELVER